MKRVLVSLVILIASFNCAIAQFSQSLFNSSGQQLVEQAVKEGIVLFRQDYQLADTLSNMRYGWNHREAFNSIYSVGFKVEGGYVVNERFIRPWEYDQRYKGLDTPYIPVIHKTYGKSIADSVYTDVVYSPDHNRAIKEGLVYSVDSLKHERRGFKVDSSLGEKAGWLVWVTAADSIPQENTQLSIVTYRYTITLEEGKNEYVLPEPSTSQNIMAGLLVVPNNTDIGVLDFQVIGYAYKEGDEWYIIRDTENTVTSEPEENNVSLLTPLTPVTASEEVAEEPVEEVTEEDVTSRRRGRR